MRLVVLDGPAAGTTFLWPGPALQVGEGTSPDLPPFELGYTPNPYALLLHDLTVAHCGVAFYTFRSGPERRTQ